MLKLFALTLLLATISAQENGADDILNDIASGTRSRGIRGLFDGLEPVGF